ncbi:MULTISPECIES: cupin domain-containing protein [unclassified Schlesneria]|uniref:cupin domain-containing protein n=1 Tax=Schlesneria TaxID=656899 RepID=UPI002EF34239
MGFIDISQFPAIEPVPGCRMRTPFGENMMLSYLEMEDGAEVPLHSHPHEQGGMLIRGTMQLTIGDETRICEAGSMFLIPPNVPHRAVAVNGPCLVMDVFSPVREDYAALANHYIPPLDSGAEKPAGNQ